MAASLHNYSQEGSAKLWQIDKSSPSCSEIEFPYSSRIVKWYDGNWRDCCCHAIWYETECWCKYGGRDTLLRVFVLCFTTHWQPESFRVQTAESIRKFGSKLNKLTGFSENFLTVSIALFVCWRYCKTTSIKRDRNQMKTMLSTSQLKMTLAVGATLNPINQTIANQSANSILKLVKS